MPDSHPIDPQDPAVAAVIFGKAAAITRGPTASWYDRDDAAQDLFAALLARRPKYNPARGTPGAFVYTAVSSAAADIRRAQRADKRQPTRPFPEAEETAGADAEASLDFGMDLATAIAALPDALRCFAEHLKALTRAELGRKLGLTRGQVATRVRALRGHFEKAGLRDYLEK